jgi:beta-phosphoglucomutase-like phosphatase (HAD superfamily)
MRAIIFDMDGVLVDAMPFHYEAMKTAIKEITNIDLDKRTFYLLEGMPGAEMALEIFKLKGYVVVHNSDIAKKDIIETAAKVAQRKKDIFMKMNVTPKPFENIRELIIYDLSNCSKAVVSGAAKQEVDTTIEAIFGKDKFDIIINGDDFEGKGKPDPAPFKVALQRLNINDPSDALVVENSPFGVKAANNAGIPCIVTLNTSPLTISDFKDLISSSKDRIFKDSKSASKFLRKWCNSEISDT